ncbi:hypothetical protein APY03_6186 [Variovorax sp. WDL1]|nr:hypothetical protein APY03_6186 [Variovorax sp. WDL1]
MTRPRSRRPDELLAGAQNATIALVARVVEVAEGAEANLLGIFLDESFGLVIAAVGLAIGFQAACRRRRIADLHAHRVVHSGVAGTECGKRAGCGWLLPQKTHGGAPSVLVILHPDAEALARSQADDPTVVVRGAVVAPVVDDPIAVVEAAASGSVDPHPDAIVGVGPKDVVAGFRRREGASESRGEVVCVDARTGARSPPLVVSGVVADGQYRRVAHVLVVVVARCEGPNPRIVDTQAHLEPHPVDADAEPGRRVVWGSARDLADSEIAIVEEPLP